MNTSLIGQSLGRYRILEQLGEGGMATVYKAYDTRLERDVAIKVIRRGAFPPDQLEMMLKRFEREAQSLAKLSHPNIVKVMDFGEYEDSPYLVMEYLPGGTFKQRLGRPVPWQEAVRLLIPIARALEYAHEHNIIHRDIKPANILLTEKGQPMLTDFGIAKILETNETANLTGTGVGIGTPDYMAPEQWMGTSTPQSDIYSLGVVFYEMVTGRKPYVADTPVAILLKQTNDQLPRPTQFVPNLPDAVEKILIKALAKNLQDRYQNISEFLAALDKLNYQNDKVSSMKPAVATQVMDKVKVEKRQPVETMDGFRTVMEVESIQPPRKKTVWWLWAIGAGGLVCCFALAILFFVLGGSKLTILLPATPTSISTMTPTMTPTLLPTLTLVPPTLPIVPLQPTTQLIQPTETVVSQFFTEEWDNGFGAWVQQVELNSSSGDKNQAKISVEDGHLAFDLGRELIAYVFFPTFSYTSVRIDAHVNNRGTNVNDVLLVCQKSEAGHYLVNIANSGLYSMYAFDGTRNSYTRIADGGSNKITQGKNVNDYTLICNGKTLTLLINGNATRSLVDNQFHFTEGQIGVGVASEEQLPVTVWFESVKISEP
jgi:tRNA A-37 threonylcarbamoyl transferase component Bud32